ncbi:response regulator transcription factor [Bradyrhizobium elkanii]|uniref:response regulator transcription factor n=1 Tax=Bradyrhizobium elkanii TaxID=29448 RepID=UPI0021679B7E|nr:response regulator [Bradyrhizobium elkanii]MCS3522215.1 FixJ family two-component response regulator [Bradyrhizobium elkanii]MCS4069869.1 FixJ family two-component response regulator [Bradyrhizobium elkanii]MCS4076500.1 FixJ family two-component response regulator [Bradyrhizobium elkanii]MCW2124942.1 FixJ family two-component response regulator [Bradyrhizobium elkanii]MCW2171688.1 FixJ family two-component response regulator [Bradyrhizobium elkanii]
MIAVIDDDPSMRIALESLLRLYEYNLAIYDSAKSFLASNIAGYCSCVISDLNMPAMSGIELECQLRHLGCEIPIIIITASRGSALSDYTRSGGICHLLTKPFRSEQLMDHLATVLGGSKL